MSQNNKNEININTSDNNLISLSETPYEFKEEPVQLVSIKDDILETTSEAINILTGLKNKKLAILSINGPMGSGKSTLANKLINKSDSGFKVREKMEGIWIWGKPIILEDDIRLLILDCQGINNDDKDNSNNINQKLFILSVLLSTCLVYVTKEELTENKINDFLFFTDLSKKISIEEENKEKLNLIENFREYFPEIFFINDTLKKEEIQSLIEKNTQHKNFYNLFEKRNYLKTDEYKEILNKIESEKNYKTIQNNIIDGEALFGLLQNYIDFMNNNENPVINSALQNILLSKANNETELISEKFKNELNKRLENKYPISIIKIYKLHYELQQKYIQDFLTKVENYLKINQIRDYLKKILINMEKELENVLETNKDYYDDWFGMEYKELEEVMNKLNSDSITNINIYFSNYSSTLQKCLNKFLNIPNIDFCKNLISILSKIFQEFVSQKLNQIGENLNNILETKSRENNKEIEKLKNEIKKLNDKIENNNTNSLGEKNISNKNYLEMESKLEKINYEMKEKQKEYENNINIEIQKYKKFEEYTNSQIKEKEKKISELEIKIEKLNQELLGSNQKNMKLQTQINLTKQSEHLNSIDIPKDTNLNLQNLFINIQNTFMDFKNSVDKLDKENENNYNLKNFENFTKETENKFSDCSISLKDYFEKQIKELGEHYEKEIKKLKDDYDAINFELTKKNIDFNEISKLKEGLDIKLKESENQIKEINELFKSKEELIETQNQTLKVYEDKINEYKKMREELELSLAKNIYNFKMKEDEFDSLFMVIEGIVSRKKEKFEHNLNKLTPETKNIVETLVKQYRFFKLSFIFLIKSFFYRIFIIFCIRFFDIVFTEIYFINISQPFFFFFISI